jgi:hypothetical protein
MPVFSRLKEGVLVITVDGDYTSNEIGRVGRAGLEDPDRPNPGPVLIDMSGAAGLHKRSYEHIVEVTRSFQPTAVSLTRVALLAPSDLAFGLMSQVGGHAKAMGIDARAFRAREDAMVWLQEMPEE